MQGKLEPSIVLLQSKVLYTILGISGLKRGKGFKNCYKTFTVKISLLLDVYCHAILKINCSGVGKEDTSEVQK